MLPRHVGRCRHQRGIFVCGCFRLVSQDTSRKRPLSHRYHWPVVLAAGLAATGFGLGAQKSGSAVMNSFGGLLIFALTANSVLSALATMSDCSLLYRARLSAPKASAILMGDGDGSIALSESMPLK